MSMANGITTLDYEINNRGEIRMTGNSYNESGGGSSGPGNNRSSDDSDFGCATFVAIAAMIGCLSWGIGFFPALIISGIGAFITHCFTKK